MRLLRMKKRFVCEVTAEAGQKVKAVPAEDAKAYVTAIYLAPNGVQSRNIKMDRFVVNSVNLGVVCANEDQLVLVFSPRSSVASLQDELKRKDRASGRYLWFHYRIQWGISGMEFPGRISDS